METAVGCDEYIIAECYFCAIQNYGVVVCEEIFTDFYVIAVVTPERGNNTEGIFGLMDGAG